MAGVLHYVAAQTSALMVVATDRVCHTSVNEKQLKALQGVVARIRVELHDSDAERRALYGQNYIVACEKAALEDHVASLEDQSD